MQNHTKSKKQKKRLEKSTHQPSEYQIVINWSEEDQCFLASAPAFKGCTTHGKTQIEALQNAVEAIHVWMRGAVKQGDYIPPPPKHYSGKLTLRLPVSLHQKIAETAEREGVSINQWAMIRLAG